MSGKRVLVKIGGSTLGLEDTTVQDLVWLHGHGYRPVVVHGGGKTVTQWLERLSLPTRFVHGLRATDEASIDVVVAVLAGLVNKRVVAAINGAGGRAVGVCGADGGTVRARIKDPELGLVGEVCRVDPAPLEALLETGYLPVVAPIGVLEGEAGPRATLLNINADTVAAEVGAALRADRFVFMTDVPGVLDGSGEVLPRLSPARTRDLVESGIIVGGMIPKVEACLRAVQAVPTAIILDGRRPHALRDSMAGELIGTRIEET